MNLVSHLLAIGEIIKEDIPFVCDNDSLRIHIIIDKVTLVNLTKADHYLGQQLSEIIFGECLGLHILLERLSLIMLSDAKNVSSRIETLENYRDKRRKYFLKTLPLSQNMISQDLILPKIFLIINFNRKHFSLILIFILTFLLIFHLINPFLDSQHTILLILDNFVNSFIHIEENLLLLNLSEILVFRPKLN